MDGAYRNVGKLLINIKITPNGNYNFYGKVVDIEKNYKISMSFKLICINSNLMTNLI